MSRRRVQPLAQQVEASMAKGLTHLMRDVLGRGTEAILCGQLLDPDANNWVVLSWYRTYGRAAKGRYCPACVTEARR